MVDWLPNKVEIEIESIQSEFYKEIQ